MTQVSEYVAKYVADQTAFQDRQDTAIDGITADFESLKADIAKLNASAGVLNAEDEALLGSITSRSEKISTKLEALDALTAPPAPELPPEPAIEPVDPNNPTNPAIPPAELASRRAAQAAPSQGTPGSAQPTTPGGMVVNPGGTGTMPAPAASRGPR